MDRTIPFTPMLKENRTNIGKSCNYFAIAMPTMIIIIVIDISIKQISISLN